MVRINSIGVVNNKYSVQNKPSFKGNTTNPQVNQLPNVQPEFAVKTPMSYSKTGEMNFPYDIKVHCYKLANGQRVVIVPMEGETVLKTYVNTGSMNETDNLRGISHYIEHNLFNGSQGIENSEFFKEVDKMGGESNASTSFAETNYYISSHLLNDNDLEKKIKLHSSMLETPLFAIEKLEKEKGIVNSEINMITSDPTNIAVNKMLKNLYGIKSTSTDLIGGTTDNINRLSREDVVNYFNNNYYPANMVTVVSGEVDPDQTMKLISKYFTSKNQPPQQRYLEKLNPILNTVREDLISDKATATTIVMGFNGPNNTKDEILCDAVRQILSGGSGIARIDNKIKQYNAECFSEVEKISTQKDGNKVLLLMSESTEENSEKVLKTIFNEIGNFEKNPPTEKEMKIIKKNMLHSFSNIFERSLDANTAIGECFLQNNPEYLNNFEKIVNSMTSQDLINTAKKYFDINKASLTIVHPASVSEKSLNENHKNASKITFTGKNKKAINPQTIKEYNTQNNYRVITQNSKTNNIKLIYKISLNKNNHEKTVAPLVLEELLNEGTINKPQEMFDSELAQDGISKNFFASSAKISSVFNCDNTTFTKSFDSLKEVIQNPRFTQESFEYAKNKIINSIKISEKSAYDKLNSELYKELSTGYSNDEMLADLEKLTLDDVKKHYNMLLKNSQGTFVVSAPFEKHPELKNELFTNISKFNSVKKFQTQEYVKIYKPALETKVLTDTDFKNQAEIIQAYKFPITQNLKDTVALNLLNIILGNGTSSRLFSDLREKEKLAYHVKSNINLTDDMGVINLRIGTTTENKETGETSFDNVQKSIDGFNRNIFQIKAEKVSEEELNNAKLNLKNDILSLNETTSDKANSLIRNYKSPYGIFKDNQLLEEIDKITVDDIYNAANYVFSGKPTYSILATENTLKANEEYLTKLSKM